MKKHQAYIILFFVLIGITKVVGQQTEKIYLSGTGSDKTVNWQFYCTGGMNSGKWTTIPVPSNWELQGFGKYDYGFAKDSVRGKEKGLYKYNFNVPASWRGKIINIVFEGSMTDTEVKINGQSAGDIHQGAFYAFKYDITDKLKFNSQNLLEVTVSKHSANPSVNEAERKADFWIFGGIFRPVYLEALPVQHITRVAIDAKANGVFDAFVYYSNAIIANAVTVQIYSKEGKKIGSAFSEKIRRYDPNLLGSSGTRSERQLDSSIRLRMRIDSPKLWSSEFPELYTAEFSFLNNGRTVHSIKQKFGFRTIEVKQRDGVYINGVKIKFKGVNRHSFRPETGRAMTRSNSIEDVLLIKSMNMNAVRMSHYPPDDHFLDVCDSLGLYVMDELAGWHGNYDTKTGAKLVHEMIVHDVNHPSIIFWANGNEGGHNFELDHYFKDYDIQKRPVVHPWQLFGGIETQHYREYNYGIGNYDNGREIVMPTEFLHGQFDGGHGAGLEDYWEKMWHNPLSAGGFLWDLADQAVVRKDKKDSLDTDKFRGADGIVGPHHEKEGSFYAIKEIWSPVYFERKEITKDFNGKLNIENRYHFTNIKQCSFTYSLEKFIDSKHLQLKGKIVSPDIMPLQKGSLQVILPNNWKQYDVLYLTASGPDMEEIFTWSFPIIRPWDVASNGGHNVNGRRPTISEQDSTYKVSANGITIRFNRFNGKLINVLNRKGDLPFTNGPVIQEGVNNFQNFSHHYVADTLIIASSFDRKISYNTLQWTIYPSGVIKMMVKYFPSEYFTTMVGVNFSFPERDIKEIEYLGNGPYRVWKNRLKGNKFGTWKKKYNATETGEQWEYPEFKGYYSNFYGGIFRTNSQSFTVTTTNEDLFVRLFTPAWKTDQWHNYEPIFPSGDISFLHGIPGIGSKTQRAETTGPMGMKNIFYDYEKDPQRALTMELYFNFSGTED